MNTAQDLVYYLLSSTGGGAQDGEHAAIRQAVVHGVREVLQARDWLWHLRQDSVTVTPSNDAIYQLSWLRPDHNFCAVNSVAGLNVGDTLRATNIFSRPPKIVAISESYGFLRNGVVQTYPAIVLDTPPTYLSQIRATPNDGSLDERIAVTVYPYSLLPKNVRSVDSLVSDQTGVTLTYVSPQEFQRLDATQTGTAEPFFYTVMRSQAYPDFYELRFVYSPPDAEKYLFTYRYTPPPIRLMGYERACRQGVITHLAAGLTSQLASVAYAYGSDTAFPAKCENAVLRLGTADEFPEPVGSLTPWQYEFRIQARNGQSQSLVLDDATLTEPILGSLAEPVNLKYSISDEIDCSPQMLTAMLSAVEMWYARIAGKDAKDVVSLFNRDLRLAMETDRITSIATTSPSVSRTPRSMGWHSTVLPDMG